MLEDLWGWGGHGQPPGQGEAAEPGARKFPGGAGGHEAGGAWLKAGGGERRPGTQAIASFKKIFKHDIIATMLQKLIKKFKQFY